MIRFMSDTRLCWTGKGNAAYTKDFVQEGAEWLSVTFLVVWKFREARVNAVLPICVPFYELLEVLAEEVAVSTFVSRVCRLTGRRNPCFFQNGHRERFWLWERSVTEPLKKQRPVLRSIFFPQIDFCVAEL